MPAVLQGHRECRRRGAVAGSSHRGVPTKSSASVALECRPCGYSLRYQRARDHPHHIIGCISYFVIFSWVCIVGYIPYIFWVTRVGTNPGYFGHIRVGTNPGCFGHSRVGTRVPILVVSFMVGQVPGYPQRLYPTSKDTLVKLFQLTVEFVVFSGSSGYRGVSFDEYDSFGIYRCCRARSLGSRAW